MFEDNKKLPVKIPEESLLQGITIFLQIIMFCNKTKNIVLL